MGRIFPFEALASPREVQALEAEIIVNHFISVITVQTEVGATVLVAAGATRWAERGLSGGVWYNAVIPPEEGDCTMPTLELPPHVHQLLETEARNHHLSTPDYLAARVKGVVPPRIGNGTYESIAALVETFEGTDEPDGFIEAIEENRAMRRQLAREREQ